MDLAAAERIARAITRVERLDRRLVELNQLDIGELAQIPQFFNSEIDERLSPETCLKIRALMREDLSARRESAMRELSNLGVEPRS